MVILGLTGSIGMGKSATAEMFRDLGVPVHDSDASVHQLYRGAAAPLVEAAFPGTVSEGVVDRPKLSAVVLKDPAAMKQLEAIIHPLVGADRDAFLDRARASGAAVAVLDIPLLFEINGDTLVDAIVVVTASEEVQKSRVLARPGMTEERFQAILGKQVRDADKRRRAHFIVETDYGFDHARRQVAAILKAVASMQAGRPKSNA
jgi:dephospho-CoA kinase